MSPLFFLSYSRQQVYYAESIVIALQKADIDIWFDLQRLEPGTDWQVEIAEGLKVADGIIVLTSKASIASPYVAQEWQAMMQSDKPIYVVIFEPVDLPPELVQSATVIIDGRGNFRRMLSRLQSAFTGENVIDPIPTPSRRHILPRRMNTSITIIVYTLLYTALLAFTAGLSSFATNNWSSLVIVGLTIAISMWMVYRLQHRNFGVWGMVAGFIGLFFLVIMVFGSSMPEEFDETAMQMTLLFILQIVMSLVSIGLMIVSPGVLRWLPPGAAGQWRRQITHGNIPFLQRRTAHTRTHESFFIYADPADTSIQRYVNRLLVKDGYIMAPDAQSADNILVILSDHTSLATTQNALNTGKNLLTIVAAPVKIPETVKSLKQYQLIDFRKRQYSSLQMALDTLHHDFQYRFNANPRNYEALVLPDINRYLTAVLRGFALSLLVIGVAITVFAFGAPEFKMALFITVLFALSAIPLLVILHAFMIRKVTNRQFIGLITLLMLFSPFTWILASDASGDLRNFVGIIYGMVFFMIASHWLPSQQGHPDFRVSGLLNRFWRNNLITITVVSLILIAITLTSGA